MKSAVGRKAISNQVDEGVPNRRFDYWALWWGISFGFAFLAAAAIGFMLSGSPIVDKSGQAKSALQHSPKAFEIVVAAVAGTLAVAAVLDS
jgi:hypothetical protein